MKNFNRGIIKILLIGGAHEYISKVYKEYFRF